MLDPFRRLDAHREWGVVFLRLIVGFHLVYGTQDNVFSAERMDEFASFLAGHGFPWPALGARVSAYTQFVCGLLLVLGAFVRPAGLLLAVNFVAALLIAHRGDSYPNMFPALMMVAAALFFLVHGAGAGSVDAALARRAGAR